MFTVIGTTDQAILIQAAATYILINAQKLIIDKCQIPFKKKGN
jgi:hypothetical protein